MRQNMDGVRLAEIRQWTKAEVVGKLNDLTPVAGVSSDSRSVRPGEVFVALSGERFDGHDHVAAAFGRGACAAVVERPEGLSGGPLLVVPSALRALGDMAGAYRARFDLPIVAVVGSAGKTTAKEMTAAVLERRYRVLKTPDNQNNEIGVPHTLLRLSADHEAAVLEMGARRVGDIAYLCSIARPTVGILLNIGTAHLEIFGSVERVAKAKGELLESIEGESSVALVNADDCVITKEAKRTKGRLLGFGLTQESHFCGEGLTLDQKGCGHFSLHSIPFGLKVPGRHNVYNALAAAAAGAQLGIPLEEAAAALGDFHAVALRSEFLRKNGICVINDCYNSNPLSAQAALDTLAALTVEGRRIAVLGDMLELGEEGPRLHAEIGRHAAAAGMDWLLATGPLSRHTVKAAEAAGIAPRQTCHFDDKEALGAFVACLARPGDAVLVKASRGVGLEGIAAGIVGEK